jgi:cell division transport system ATP-binding protein
MIQLVDVTKTFGTGASALENVTLGIDHGEFVFLVGSSGSGKTTLLRLLMRDMMPTKGIISVNNVDIVNLPSNKIPLLRKQIGVVFQDLKMLMDRTIFENILLPLEMSGASDHEARKKVEDILLQVGIEEHAHKFPIQLSGGELQRAAIARALVFSPKILLADEPTGNLDNTTAWEIIKLLQDINKMGTTVIMATHNMDVVTSLGKRTVTLEKGRLTGDTKTTTTEEVTEVPTDDAPTETVTEEKKLDTEETLSHEHKKTQHKEKHEKKTDADDTEVEIEKEKKS